MIGNEKHAFRQSFHRLLRKFIRLILRNAVFPVVHVVLTQNEIKYNE
jgi:hypothetical protein